LTKAHGNSLAPLEDLLASIGTSKVGSLPPFTQRLIKLMQWDTIQLLEAMAVGNLVSSKLLLSLKNN
jgi:hypothetical protein